MPLSDADRELLELQRSMHTQGANAGVPAAVADPDVIRTFELRRAAQREAYGQFVALAPIHYGGALVFQTGQQVPLEHVINYDLESQELVARVATPEMARAGKAFDSDDEFHAANPHVKARAVVVPELHPAALDPRGGAAEKDDARKTSRPSRSSAASDEGGRKAAGKAE